MTIIILSNGTQTQLPEGADPESYRRFCEAKIRLAANPKPRRPSRHTRAPRATKREQQFRIQSALGRSMTTLVERVNRPGGESDTVLMNASGGFYGVIEL